MMSMIYDDAPHLLNAVVVTDVTPARLCCSQRHWGPVCPDGLVMCCTCYGRYEPDELHVDATGVTWDMCAGCAQQVGE